MKFKDPPQRRRNHGKFEARNPKYETISNDKMSNVQNYKIEQFKILVI